ncbi:hypothetical protein BKA69DRAFT_148131 [Paraphysoderma sedebokerense]|nr:hypothetical protein BKA69DRAFT_148131 [Paraphysoderma sedebokerense]
MPLLTRYFKGNPTADARSKLAEAIIKIYKEKESCNVDQVIEKFASAIDHLEAEREHLKQTTVSAAKYIEVARELKQLKKERTESIAKPATNKSENKTSEDISQLKRQLNAQTHSIQELKKSNETKAKEISSLKRKLMSAHSLLEENSNNSEVIELKKQLTEKEETIIHLLNSEAKLNQPHYENNIRKLKTEIDTWRAKYEKLKKKITGNEVLNNGDGAISDELATLKQQNETLQKEISAFKEKRIDSEESRQHLKALETNQLGLLEELEDLKINYQEAVNLNVVYEEELQRHGVNVDMLKELGQISM